VTVTDLARNRTRVTVSTSDGVYTAAALAPGEYRIDVELAGFRPVRRERVRLATGEKVRVDFSLSVGSVRERINVTIDAAMLRAETAGLGAVVGHEQVVELPLNGRTCISLAALA